MLTRPVFAALAVVSVTATACGQASHGSDGPSFGPVYDAVIVPRCLPCHSLADAQVDIGGSLGLLDFSDPSTAYAALVNVRAAGLSCKMTGLLRVAPGSASTSLLFLKVDAFLDGGAPLPCGDPMPDDGTVLTQADVDMLQGWINGGAAR